MSAYSLPFLLSAAWLAATSTAHTAADRNDLQGVWVATSMEINGEPAPAREVERTRFTFRGEKLLVRHSKDEGKEEESTFKADPKKSPRHLDITIKNKVLHGIYEVKGDELKICFENGGGRAEDRPRKFATNKEQEMVLIVFKRQKP